MADENSSRRDSRWWTKANETERARLLTENAAALWKDQRPARDDMKRAMRLYGNFPYVGIGPRMYHRQNRQMGRALSFNVTKAVIDTYVSQLTKDRVKVTVQPIDADWDTAQKCKALETGLDGIAYETELYETSTQVARDSAVFGTGIIHPSIDTTSDPERPRIVDDRILPWNLLLDPLECMNAKPSTAYIVTWMDKYILREDFPKHAQKLFGYSPAGFDDDSGSRSDIGTNVDLIPVVESWHVARNGEPGRYSRAVGDIDLVDEEYPHTFLPVEGLTRQKPTMGWYGESLALELEPIQTQINVLLDKILRSHRLLAAGYWLIENGSDIISNQLTNQIGHVIRYRGVRPSLEAPNTVATEIYAHLQTLYDKAFELPGVNQMMAQSKQPSGDYSGRARLVDAAIQSQRFKPAYERFQNMFMRLGRQHIALGRQISEDHGEWSIPAQTERDVWTAIRWADAHLDESQFMVRLKPTNALADDPEGLIETATELTAGQMLSPQQGLRVIMQNEDLAALLKQHNASYNLTMKMGNDILNKGEYRPPEGEMNLPESIQEISMLKLNAEIEGAPEERVQMLERWLVQANVLLTKSQPPAPPPTPGPTPSMGPGGQPVPQMAH